MKQLDNINICEWHQVRFLSYIPEHFTVVNLEGADDRNALMEWISENTTGRVGIEKDKSLKNRSTLVIVNDNLKIGFEDPEEATMYAMFFR
jgi:hypothetical protein